MDHVFGGQPVSFGDLGFSGLAAAKCPAFSKQLRPGCPVDSPVGPAPSQQRRICRIDDGIGMYFGDVISDNFKRHSGITTFIMK